ncbi:MAG TPA: DUF952 domain-containing protein [Cyclobacteriaceae bacterium]|jgi:uncharacterized protein (DUF952 family)|nr:DUF952 domain-containing protein [Cyclobacteriaceae bacterium]
MIYHIATRQDWVEREQENDFVPSDYHREGFVHCCTASQLAGVKERYFKGKTGLVILYLEEEKLKAELKYEVSTDNEKFPHLYGAINREAIFKIEPLKPD